MIVTNAMYFQKILMNFKSFVTIIENLHNLFLLQFVFERIHLSHQACQQKLGKAIDHMMGSAINPPTYDFDIDPPTSQEDEYGLKIEDHAALAGDMGMMDRNETEQQQFPRLSKSSG